MTLKLRSRVNFPANVTADGGLQVVKQNGIWTVSPSWGDLDLITTLASPEMKEIWARDPATETYYRIQISALIATLPAGPTGPAGATGATGAAAGLKYAWLTSTTNADPGSGNVRGNNATIASITNLYISETDANANGVSAVIATWDDSTSAIKSTVKIYDPTNEANFAIFSVTGSITDNGTWDTIPVAFVASGGTLTNALTVRVNTILSGNAGTNGAVAVSGTPTVNQFTAWVDATTVKGVSITGIVKGNGASAPTAAVSGTDYAPATSGSSILKGNGSGGFSSAAAGTDYQAADAQLFSNIPQNSQSAAYTLVASDAQKHIYHPSADTTARTWTIPANASVAYPIGTAITFINDSSAGVITIAINTDTLVLAGAGSTGSRSLAANGIATAIKKTSTSWMISGTGLT